MSLPCLIERGARFDGLLAFESGVRIEGELVGSIVGAGEGVLDIAPGARVEGRVEVHTLWIQGELSGAVRAPGKIIVGPSATARGRFEAGALEVRDGGAIEGPVSMTRPDPEQAPGDRGAR